MIRGTPPTVSVVIPTNDRPELLAQALTSVAAQTVAAHEILVVDDGRAAEHPRPTVVGLGEVHWLSTGGGAGASATRNLGAAAASGTHLAFLDDDDRWRPTFLERCLAALAASDARFCVAWIDIVEDDRQRPGLAMVPAVSAAATRSHNAGMTGSNSVIERSLFEETGGFDPELPALNDLDLLVRLLETGAPYTVVAERLVEQYHHPGWRITSDVGVRLDGLLRYQAKWAHTLTGRDRRRLAAERAAVRRRGARSRPELLLHVARELSLLGPGEAVHRLVERSRWSPHDPGHG